MDRLSVDQVHALLLFDLVQAAAVHSDRRGREQQAVAARERRAVPPGARRLGLEHRRGVAEAVDEGGAVRPPEAPAARAAALRWASARARGQLQVQLHLLLSHVAQGGGGGAQSGPWDSHSPRPKAAAAAFENLSAGSPLCACVSLRAGALTRSFLRRQLSASLLWRRGGEGASSGWATPLFVPSANNHWARARGKAG